MKHTLLCSALVLLAAASVRPVSADDITPEPPFTSTVTRAEVVAAMEEFRRAGIDPWSDRFVIYAGQDVSTRTRDDASSEYVSERDQVAGMNAEDSGSSYMASHPQALAARAPVEGVQLLAADLLIGQ